MQLRVLPTFEAYSLVARLRQASSQSRIESITWDESAPENATTALPPPTTFRNNASLAHPLA